jgi:hypothetical protein
MRDQINIIAGFKGRQNSLQELRIGIARIQKHLDLRAAFALAFKPGALRFQSFAAKKTGGKARNDIGFQTHIITMMAQGVEGKPTTV